MEKDLLDFISSPPGIFLIALNSVLVAVIAITNFFALRSNGKTMEANSKAYLLVIEQASKLVDTANAALREMGASVAATIEATEKAVSFHNQESDIRHQQGLDIQKNIAETLNRQTLALDVQSNTIKQQAETMSSQVSIMQDMSDADRKASESIGKTSETIETRIAPTLEELRGMVIRLLDKLEKFSPEELMSNLGAIQNKLESLASLIEKVENDVQQKADAITSDPAGMVGAAVGDDPGAG